MFWTTTSWPIVIFSPETKSTPRRSLLRITEWMPTKTLFTIYEWVKLTLIIDVYIFASVANCDVYEWLFLNSIRKNLFFSPLFSLSLCPLSPFFGRFRSRLRSCSVLGEPLKKCLKKENSFIKRYFFCSFPLLIKVKHNQRNFSLALTKVTSKFFVPSFCFTKDQDESDGTIS